MEEEIEEVEEDLEDLEEIVGPDVALIVLLWTLAGGAVCCVMLAFAARHFWRRASKWYSSVPGDLAATSADDATMGLGGTTSRATPADHAARRSMPPPQHVLGAMSVSNDFMCHQGCSRMRECDARAGRSVFLVN